MVNIFQKINKHLISIFYVVLVTYIVSRNSTRILFDDVILELCYSGYFSGGTPVSDHLFQHFFLTQLLSGLYSLFTSVNWYFYLHLLFLIVSFYTMLRVLKNEKNKYFILSLVVLLFFIEYIYFTYTRVSFYVAFSGFLFFLKYQKIEGYKLYYSIFLIFLGSIIRPESAVLALIVFLLLFICNENFKQQIVFKSTKKQLLLLIAIPLLILISHRISNVENSKRFPISEIAESKQYLSSNIKATIFDSNDYSRIQNFYFDERFTSEKVINYVKSKKQKEDFKFRVEKSVVVLEFFYSLRFYHFLFFILLLQILVLKGYTNKIRFILIIVFLNVFLMFLYGFMNLPIFKDRVMEPLLLSLIISCYSRDSSYDSKIKMGLSFLILSTFCYILYVTIWKDEYIKQEESIEIGINKVFDHIPKNELIFDVNLFTYNLVFPANCKPEDTKNYKNHQILPIGWAQRSYSSKALYDKYKVKRMDDLLIKKNTTFLIDSSQFSLWVNYGEKYLDRDLVPYDTIYVDNKNSFYYLARYKSKI